MNTAITTLDHLVKFESEYNYSDSHRVLGFIRLQLNQKNTEVLDYFFSLLSKNEISKRYATDDFVSMILRSRWPAAHKALANYLIDHPYEVTSALHILGADKNVFTSTVEVIVESLKNNPPETSRHVQMLENLALAAVQNNAPELYEWCHQQSLAIDPYTSPFEFRHDQICEQAVNYGAWWALKSIAQWCKPYVFYKAFEHATTFAPVEILEDLYTSFPHHFPVEFSGRAAEYLSKREPTPQMLELIARIVVKHPQVKIPNPLPLWELCQKFSTNQQHADHALNVADRIWAGSLSSEPILFMLHILRDKKSVALSAPLLRHISQTHPETYAMAFTPVSRTHTAKKFAIPAEIVDELIFAVNDATDRLLVDNGYDTEKVNALRQNIALTHEVYEHGFSSKGPHNLKPQQALLSSLAVVAVYSHNQALYEQCFKHWRDFDKMYIPLQYTLDEQILYAGKSAQIWLPQKIMPYLQKQDLIEIGRASCRERVYAPV